MKRVGCYLLLLVLCTGCASLGLVAYEPAKSIKYMNLVDADLKEGQSMGKVKGESCGFSMFFFINFSRPKADEAIQDLKKQGVRYLKDVNVPMPMKEMYLNNLFGFNCIKIEGLGFR